MPLWTFRRIGLCIRQMADEGVKRARIARITGISRPTIYRVMANQSLENHVN